VAAGTRRPWRAWTWGSSRPSGWSTRAGWATPWRRSRPRRRRSAAHLGVDEATIAAGIEAASFPGRYQRLARAPWLIADTAHNPQAFQALADIHGQAHPGAAFELVLGLKADKDAAGIAPYLARMARVVHVVDGEDLRPAADLATLLRAQGLAARPAGALTALPALVADLRARATDLLVTGSHHVVGALLASRVARGEDRAPR